MLMKLNNSRNNDDSSLLKFVKEALALRHSATVALMRSLQEAIAAQQARSESLSLALNGETSNEDVSVALQNHNDHLKEVVGNVRQAISIVNEKHKRYLNEIDAFKSNYPEVLQETKRLSGELEETMAELDESRRKLVIQQLQRHGGSLMNISGSNGVNGSLSTDKSSDKSMGWGDLKDAVDEAKVLLSKPNSIVLHMYALYMPYLLSLYLIAAICPMEARLLQQTVCLNSMRLKRII
jgi:E3 ubiquitin-protein ligase BRE1